MDTACGSDPPQSKKVCVIGAGMAGLAAARELRREGHDVTVLEQSGDVGGQWLYDPRTDAADPLGVAAPVKVHSSMYASLRLISPRQSTGFTDFPFCPKSGRDDRRFPGHREVDLYLKDFCDAFGLMDAVRLNTRVLRAAMTPARRWAVRSVDLGVGECDGADEKKLDAYVDEVFDAVVVATGHYSQPRLPSIKGMETWRGRQMHSHSYRVPEPFRGEVVVVVGCGESGKDIAMEIRGVAKEVYLVAGSMEAVTPGLSKVLAKHSANLHLRLEVERLCEDGRVAFKDGGGSSSSVAADTVIYCTGYSYSFPFLETGGAVTVDDNRVGPLFEHVFPPSLAPSLSFVGVPRKIFAPRFFEIQARWVAQVLSGRRALPAEEEMRRSVEEFYRARDAAGVPRKYTHEIGRREPTYMDDFGEKYCDFPRVEGWRHELLGSFVRGMMENLETFRDDYQDSDSIHRAMQEWHLSCVQSSPPSCCSYAESQAAVPAQLVSVNQHND
ncbi:flavin-containing monooxygenase FMO GS-OX-like 8 [Aegilops tauschii subsp. strangulata]|uniref:Flavin-containing monooxygenase n=1 Tax=Aegilops tauschii subsp. strangulata TaxID=200361 RepID=A0A453ISK2_AEGTS|nr:flavin-containing monooxygenase FMO GS-OX-like 8 [Aegilops tauschii subsp. strangulata]